MEIMGLLIVKAMKMLAGLEGIFAEPSGAAGLAGLIKALEDGKVDKDETIVVLVTGHGLKDPDIIRKTAGDAPLINSVEDELKTVLRNEYGIEL